MPKSRTKDHSCKVLEYQYKHDSLNVRLALLLKKTFGVCFAEMTCTQISELEQGSVSTAGMDGTRQGDILTFTCNTGYDLMGAGQVLCNAGQWSAPTPICERKTLNCSSSITRWSRWWSHMASQNLVNIGTGNGLCVTTISHYQTQCVIIISDFHGIFMKAISMESVKITITKLCIKMHVYDSKQVYQGPLLPTWISFNPSVDKVIASIIKYEMQPLKFGNG